MTEARRAAAGNIAQYLSEMASLQPDRPAVICAERNRSAQKPVYRQLTFRQLDDQSSQLASGFEAIGIRRGTRTALLAPPSLDFFSITFALFKVGAAPVLIDPGIGIRKFSHCLTQAQP